jgi:putative ubiquitin-RnfH superfamily antitoxin RatB of RatAB toxin-antitoxin module
MREQPVDTMTVEVAYALPHKQMIISIVVKTGTTAQEAIQQSGIMQVFPGISLESSNIGIFGKAVSLHAVLHPLDRVEIYRPLMADPKEARRMRAALTPRKNNAGKSQPTDSTTKAAKIGQPKTENG